MTTAISVKSRLKYLAQKEGRNVQDLFTLYVLERTLYRLSISQYADHFTLKGGILLYSLFHEDYSRATTDIDLLGGNISNDAEQIRDIFRDIFMIPQDDAIDFAMDTLSVKNITEFKKYHSVNISIMAYLDRTRIPVNIDIGYGDVIIPGKQRMEYPVILENETPILYCYSVESIIAEKFEAIVSLGKVNSRYKDFYDICELAGHFDFDGNTLKEALAETFAHRGTKMDHIAAFEPDFADDVYRKSRWKGFLKTKHVQTDMTLEDAISRIRCLLDPLIEAIGSNLSFDYIWHSAEQEWK